jgi:hypothetical protein
VQKVDINVMKPGHGPAEVTGTTVQNSAPQVSGGAQICPLTSMFCHLYYLSCCCKEREAPFAKCRPAVSAQSR